MKLFFTRRVCAAIRRTGLALLLVLALVGGPVYGLDTNRFHELYQAGDYQGLVDFCGQVRGEMLAHEYADRLLSYCGNAQAKLFEQSGQSGDLMSAIDDLERSLYLYYMPGTSFALGQTRLAAIDQTSGREEKRVLLRQAMDEMWDAIFQRHAEEGFATEVLSDAVLKWSVDYHEVLVDRIILEQEDPAVVRWLTARARMLTDRYAKIDPTKGENETRQGNLETISSWMNSLYEASYFDRNAVVGMYKYMGDRREGEYDQTEATVEKFHKSLYYYNQGLDRGARSLKAKAVLHERIAYLCTLYQSEDKSKKVGFYKQGFHNAAEGLKLMDRIAKRRPDQQNMFYRFEPENGDLVSSLQKHYGSNLSGLIYFLWERGDHQTVIALRRNAWDTGFDWKTKANDLLRIADSAKKLAHHNVGDISSYRKYKEMCLTSASRAFKFTLKKFKGKQPLYDSSFCEAFSAYSMYLAGFGERVESTSLDRVYGSTCENPPAAQTEEQQ